MKKSLSGKSDICKTLDKTLQVILNSYNIV